MAAAAGPELARSVLSADKIGEGHRLLLRKVNASFLTGLLTSEEPCHVPAQDTHGL